MGIKFLSSATIGNKRVLFWAKEYRCMCDDCLIFRSPSRVEESLFAMDLWENNFSPEAALQAVTHDGMNIQWIRDPSEELCLVALKQNVCAFHYIGNKTLAMCEEALKEEHYNHIDQDRGLCCYHPIIDLPRMTDEAYEKILRYAPYAIQYIDNPSDTLVKTALGANGLFVKVINNPTEDQIWIALKSNTKSLKYITCPTDAMIDYALSIDGTMIKYVHDKTDDRCAKAVKNNANALDFIDLTKVSNREELIWLAVQQDPSLIALTISPSQEMIDYVLSKNPLYLQFVSGRAQTKEMCMEAITANPYALYGAKEVSTKTRKKIIAKHPNLVAKDSIWPRLFALPGIEFSDIVMEIEIALRTHWSAIKFDQIAFSDETLEHVVNQNGMALRWIHRKSDKLIRLGLANNPCAYTTEMSEHANLVPEKIRSIIESEKASIDDVYEHPWLVNYCPEFDDYEWLFSTNIETCILFEDVNILVRAVLINPKALDYVHPKHILPITLAIEQMSRYGQMKSAKR